MKTAYKPYSEKLKDPRWQRKRLEIMERDDFSCKICMDCESTLNVHHSYYGKGLDPWDYDSEYLMTLCEECHKDVEQKREEILKHMTWEIPIYAIHGFATCGDDFLMSHISAAFNDEGTTTMLAARAKFVRIAIERLEEIADAFEHGRKWRQKPSFDDLIDSAPDSLVIEPPPWETAS